MQKREEEYQCMEEQLRSLRDQVNMYHSQLSSDTDVTPVTTPTSLSDKYHNTELHISETHDVSMSSQISSSSSSVTHSRPVSFISVNSETSDPEVLVNDKDDEVDKESKSSYVSGNLTSLQEGGTLSFYTYSVL